MAAVIRHARAGRGGPGRAQGLQRGAVMEHLPEQDRNAPLNYQWAYWTPGNENVTKKKNKNEDQQLKIYRVLENSPRVNKMELVYFIIPEGLLNQRPEIVNKLRDVVSLYNMMMPMRREFCALYEVCPDSVEFGHFDHLTPIFLRIFQDTPSGSVPSEICADISVWCLKKLLWLICV